MPLVLAHFAVIDRLAGADTPIYIAVFTFASVFLAALAVMQIVTTRQAVRRRAVAFNPASGGPGSAASATGLLDQPGSAAHEFAEVSEVLYSIEAALSGDKDRRVSKLRKELITAGFFRADAVFWFYLARLGCAVLFSIAAFLLLQALAPAATIATAGGIIAPAVLLGLVAPGFFLGVRQRQLRQQCRNGFPNFLDLLVVCAEGGLTPRAGIERVSREITVSHPYLGANLFLMSLELRAGRPLVEAMENLGRRVEIEEVRSLGSLLQQTEELGTKLSDALRVFSEDMRARRLMRAEEKAHALPVKLVLPLAFFVFPVMLVVVLLPVLVRIHKAFL